MFEIIGTAWICGSNDHLLLRNWYMFTMVSLFATRLYSFYRKNYLLYLLEMCYLINIVSMISVYFNVGLEYVYPFLHGPLIAYSLYYCDALILHDLDKTTSLAIHSFGAIITRRLYWQGDPSLILKLGDLTFNTFLNKMLTSFVCYLFWAVPYCIFYLFPFNGNGYTMIRYVARVDNNVVVDAQSKIKYIFCHMLCCLTALVFGNLSMFCWQLDYAIIVAQIMSGIIHGGWYYYKDHKFKVKDAHKEVMESIRSNVKINSSTLSVKLKEDDDKIKHLQMKLGDIPKIITTTKEKIN